VPDFKGITLLTQAFAISKLASVGKPTLRVTKWLSMTPAVAVCTGCAQEFKVPLTALSRTRDAQEHLQKQFDEHKCAHQQTEAVDLK
jgi:hypothetical protein